MRKSAVLRSFAQRDKIAAMAPCDYFSRSRLFDAGYYSLAFQKDILKFCAAFRILTMRQLLAMGKSDFTRMKSRTPRVCVVIELVLYADGIIWR